MTGKKIIETGKGVYRSTSFEVKPPDTWWQTQVKSWKLYKENKYEFWEEYETKKLHSPLGNLLALRNRLAPFFLFFLVASPFALLVIFAIRLHNSEQKAEIDRVTRHAQEFIVSRPQEALKLEKCFCLGLRGYMCRLLNTSSKKLRFIQFTTEGELMNVNSPPGSEYTLDMN